MIHISLYDFWNILVDCDDYKFLKHCSDFFAPYATSFQFNPAYQMGRWDGKIRFFTNERTLPYGILVDFVKFVKKNYSQKELIVEDEVLNKYRTTDNISYSWNLKYSPRWYQEECIRAACEKKSGIFRCPTASGKSLIISYICTTLKENKKINKALIVVPQLNLITQFMNDMIDYGINKDDIGEVYSKKKEFDKTFVISTWQSLKNQKDMLCNFDCIIIDECHQGKATQIKEILKTSKAEYRIGVTGTLPDEEIDILNIKSYLGTVLKEYSMSQLRDEGFLADCCINIYDITYKKSKFYGEFDDVRDQIFKNPFRLNLLKSILQEKVKDSNVLLLVNYIDREGVFLKTELESFFPEKEIIFISGAVKKDDRELARLRACANPENFWIISTYPVFQAGVNIPNLKYVGLIAPYKSKIRVLQSIGRTLRPHESKIGNGGSQIFDFIDNNNKWFPKHGRTRKVFYARENFPIKEISVKEN